MNDDIDKIPFKFGMLVWHNKRKMFGRICELDVDPIDGDDGLVVSVNECSNYPEGVMNWYTKYLTPVYDESDNNKLVIQLRYSA